METFQCLQMAQIDTIQTNILIMSLYCCIELFTMHSVLEGGEYYYTGC